MIYIYQYRRGLEFMKVLPHNEGGMVRVFKPIGKYREKRWGVVDIDYFKNSSNPLMNFELILDMEVEDDGQISE